MSETPKGQRLGRGLSALLGETERGDYPAPNMSHDNVVPIESISRNPEQPRRRFVEEDLETLSQSIAQNGVLQPIIVRPIPGGDGYQIVAGERRWRAAQRANLHEVPVMVRDLSDREVLEIALVENIQRTDLDPVEEARGFQMLAEQFNHTQEDIARAVGKSRSAIANAIRLLSLPQSVQDQICDGNLSVGHGRALINAQNAQALADKVVRQGLNVRQTEALVRAGTKAPETKGRDTKTGTDKDPDTLALEEDMTRRLGLAVSITSRANGSGQVQINFKSFEQLDDVCRRLTQE
jgi:ParB family transcriptional regulator, chromosome partitioning protein